MARRDIQTSALPPDAGLLPALDPLDEGLFVHGAPRSVNWNRGSIPPEVYEQKRARLT